MRDFIYRSLDPVARTWWIFYGFGAHLNALGASPFAQGALQLGGIGRMMVVKGDAYYLPQGLFLGFRQVFARVHGRQEIREGAGVGGGSQVKVRAIQ